MGEIAAQLQRSKRRTLFALLPVFLLGLLGAPQASAADGIPSPALSMLRSSSVTPVILPCPNAHVREMGRELVQTHRLTDSQAIQFSYQGYVYESNGCRAVSSLEEARTLYPDCPIPKALGDYHFEALTPQSERTRTLYPGSLDAVRILESRPSDNFLFYTDGETHFRIQLLPCRDSEEQENWEDFSFKLAVWPLHPEVYWQAGEEEGEEAAYSCLAIPPGPGESYGYLVLRVGPSRDLKNKQPTDAFDFLESGHYYFTEQQALSIYEGIRERFAVR